MNQLYQNDLALLDSQGCLIGVDEAGRGAWAGPVVVAAVCLDYSVVIPLLDDSKKLSPARREAIYEELLGSAIGFRIVEVGQDFIDSHNILSATLFGMRGVVNALVRRLRKTVSQPDRDWLCLIDGNHLPPGLKLKAQTVIGGDGRHACIAAASILAKVHRDRLMRSWHQHYPMYGFDRHKGYGTQFHREAIARHGICPLHRKSFSPCSLEQGRNP